MFDERQLENNVPVLFAGLPVIAIVLSVTIIIQLRVT